MGELKSLKWCIYQGIKKSICWMEGIDKWARSDLQSRQCVVAGTVTVPFGGGWGSTVWFLHGFMIFCDPTCPNFHIDPLLNNSTWPQSDNMQWQTKHCYWHHLHYPPVELEGTTLQFMVIYLKCLSCFPASYFCDVWHIICLCWQL